MLRIRIKSLDDLPLDERVEVDIEALEDEDPVPMLAACKALYDMGMDDEHVTTNMRKIAYREAGRVRAFLANVSEKPKEKWQGYLTEFAKHVDYALNGDDSPTPEN